MGSWEFGGSENCGAPVGREGYRVVLRDTIEHGGPWCRSMLHAHFFGLPGKDTFA
ncbi:hypothetical protein GCM10022284_37920 [Streptomyces hundungensis]